MADNLVYEESLNTEIDTSEFISKKYVYVNDNNNGNYTSQIVIDSTPLSNAGGWINWSEGFIVMPLLVELTSTAASLSTDATSSASDYSWAFKNGFWNMINSMTVEFNNQNVVQQTPFLNVFRSFKCLTSWSNNDLENHGSSCGFCPDSSDSWSFSNDFSVATGQPVFNGSGQNVVITNNRNCEVKGTTITNAPVATTNVVADINTAFQTLLNSEQIPQSDVVGVPTVAGTSYSYAGVNNPTTATNAYIFQPSSSNKGMLQRQKDLLNDTTAGNLGQGTLNSANACDSVYRNTKTAQSTSNHTWKVYAKLRLKDLADLFEKCPLLKGSTMRFYINTNQSLVSFSSTKAVLTANTGAIATNSILFPTAVNVVGGLSNPLMIASNLVGQGGSGIPNATQTTDTLQLSVSIVRNNFTQAGKTANASTNLTSCRLYAPVYTMNPIAESKYLSLAPTKRIKYNDIFQYQFNSAQGPFNFLVSNGINNIQSVLVVPFYSTNNSYTADGTNKTPAAQTSLLFNQQLNPCSATPAMPDPIMLTNFNILISGVQLFLNNENYDFEAFSQQLAQSNQLNGNLTTGLTSGLISERMFSQAYRYYYGNCSRILPSEEGVSRSVQIVGQISSVNGVVEGAKVDFMVFVEFQREMVIDVATGARIE